MKAPGLAITVDAHSQCYTAPNPKPAECAKGKCSNLGLTNDRAAAVVKFLKSQSCNNPFTAKGYGCMHPEVASVKLVRIYAGKAPKYEPGTGVSNK